MEKRSRTSYLVPTAPTNDTPAPGFKAFSAIVTSSPASDLHATECTRTGDRCRTAANCMPPRRSETAADNGTENDRFAASIADLTFKMSSKRF